MIGEFYRDKRLLVTGGSGFLASNLVVELRDTQCCIRRLSRHGRPFTPVRGAAYVEDMTGDITDKATWERALKGIDLVFHFAAQTSVYAANEDPAGDFTSNVSPMLHMLETCRRRDLHPVVLFSGTVTEAGMTTQLPVDETYQDNPVTVYDLHKLMAESYLKYYVRQGAVRGAVLRLANVYGPGPKSSGAARGVLNAMIKKALEGGTLTVYGHGNHVRDYVYVGDAARAFLEAGSRIDRLDGGHYVIGSGVGHTVSEAVHTVAARVGERVGRAVSVVHVDPPHTLSPIEERDFIADPGRFLRETGWTASTSLEEGIDRTIDYFLAEGKGFF